jgi:hypothetical protein
MTGTSHSTLDLKRWIPITYKVGDGAAEISMEMKRLRRHEARPLQKLLTKIFGKLDEVRNSDLSATAQAEMLAEVYDLMPEDELRKWFGECVRNVEGFRIDSVAIETGEGLFQEADDALVLFALMNLFRLSKLSAVQGNASASLSTSSPQSEAEGSSSVAASIESGGGPSHSIAEAIQAEPVSSSESVEA